VKNVSVIITVIIGRVLILGGGVAGIAAARQLSTLGMDNFIIIEGYHRLGGRLRAKHIGNRK